MFSPEITASQSFVSPFGRKYPVCHVLSAYYKTWKSKHESGFPIGTID